MIGLVTAVTENGVTCRLAGGTVLEIDRDLCYDDPQVGDIGEPVEMDGEWMLEQRSGRGYRVVPCTAARPKGGNQTVEFDAVVDGRQVSSEPYTVQDLDLADFDEAKRLQGVAKRFGLLAAPDGSIRNLMWPEGGLAGVRAGWEEGARAAEEKKARDAAKRARQRAVQDDVFVNPYTYVPFPSEPPDRRPPTGHARLRSGDGEPEGLCGWFDVDIEVLTPLLIRYGKSQDEFPRRSGVSFIPGSSLKGAIRSLHETLTGSCLRIVDLDHLPVYRDQVKPRSDGWKLARVSRTGYQNRVEEVQVCDAEVWVDVDLLHQALGGPDRSRTGARVNVDQWSQRNARKEATEVSKGDGWVILVTDSGARRPRTKSGDKQPYYFVAGQLGHETATVTTEAWTHYLDVVEGAEDLRKARGTRKEGQDVKLEIPRFEPVKHGLDKAKVGERRTAALGFEEDEDVVWVRLRRAGDRQFVDEIALSHVWRSKGTGTVEERVPKGFAPCTGHPEPTSEGQETPRPDTGQKGRIVLCPSCRVFGSADTEGDAPGRRLPGEAARQASYGGHVRIGDALPAGGSDAAKTEQVTLAPMGRPRLGAGQFTLDNRGQLDPAERDQPPTSRWGAAPDQGQNNLRVLRGRRMYWHGDPRIQKQPRHRARKHQVFDQSGERRKMANEVELLQPPATFRARIHFDGLTRGELGGLLAAVAPALLLEDYRPDGFEPEGEIGIRIGGGKPFGLGSARTAISRLHVDTGQSRYGTRPPPDVSAAEAVGELVETVPEGVRSKVWPALAAVLNTGHVNPERIWYPPGRAWDPEQAGTEKYDEQFDKPFEFFKASAGSDVGGVEAKPMIPLSDPREPDQYLDIQEGK